MKNFIIVVLLLLVFGITAAQNIPTYCTSFGSGQNGRNLCGVATFDGGYIVAGISYYGGNGQNNYIAKYDGNGNIAWQHDVGNGSTNDFNDVTETSDHYIIVTGYQNGKMIVIKYTYDGVEVWSKELTVLSITYGQSIIETSEGNLLITGTSFDFSNYYTIIIKLDSEGNLIWNKNFDVGFDSGDDGYSCMETADHHYVIGIYGASINDFFYLLELDTAGNQIWAKESSASGVPYDLVATADSGLVVAGYMCTIPGCDAMLSRLNKNGNLIWSYTYGDSLFDRFYSITSTTDGGFAVAGDATDQDLVHHGFVASCDSDGQLRWSKISDDNEFRSIDNSTDGRLILSLTGASGSLEFGVKKIDETGNSCCILNSYGFQQSGTTFNYLVVSAHSNAATISDASFNEIFFTPSVIQNCSEAGVEETVKNNFSIEIFPNPSLSGIFKITFPHFKSDSRFMVFDLMGRKLYEGKIPDSTFTLDLSSVPKGEYLLGVSGKEEMATGKLIIE